jgi:carboxyl-terminal processing protease
LAEVAHASEPLRDVTYLNDFDELWETLNERYCYFEEKATDWKAVRKYYRPRMQAVTSDAAFTDIIRLVLAELYDAHTHLAAPAKFTPYWPPYDMLVQPDGNGAKVVGVYEGSAAEDAEIQPGDVITAVDGLPIRRAAAACLPKCLSRPDPAANVYAVNVAVGGLRGRSRQLTIARPSGALHVSLPEKVYPALPDLEAKATPEGYGLITIRSFGSDSLITQFDAALDRLSGLKGLIIDVRYNGGGDTAVARPIMGRFIQVRRPYALMRRRDGIGLSSTWTEYVDPRGPFTYRKPVVVMCGHWSASMAEGFPMGMRDIGRATIVGTAMMGLGAAVYDITLDRTGTKAQYSAEPVYDTRGAARSRFVPDIVVPAGQNILAAAKRELAHLTGS